MRIGDLKHLIELQKPTPTSDNMGGFNDVYTTESDAWAAIWPVSAKDQIQAGQLAGEITHRIRIRYDSEVRSSWRVKYGERYFAIVAPPINQNEANRVIELLCKEIEMA